MFGWKETSTDWLPALASMEACTMHFAHVWLPARGSYACLYNAVCHVWLLADALMQACTVFKAGPIANMPDLVIPSNADLHN